MFICSKAVRNAFAIYSTYLVRRDPKPTCYIPKQVVRNEKIFADDRMCLSCTCKFACRYSDDHTDGNELVPVLIPLPEYNWIPPEVEKKYA